MSHPRWGLTRNLKADKLDVSFGKTRLGFTFRTSRQLSELRGPYFRKYLKRLECLHEESGRYFAQPSDRYLKRALLSLSAEQALSSTGLDQFLNVQRLDRIRRLPSLTSRTAPSSVNPIVRRMALRLESLSWTHRPEKLWQGMGRDFDDLWRTTRLYSRRLGAVDKFVFRFLQKLRVAHGASSKKI